MPFRVDDRLGTWGALMEATAPPMRAVAEALRAQVAACHPDALETARLKEGAASYGFGPRKMSDAHTYIFPHSAHVNLGFYHGAAIADPPVALAGSGKGLRHLRIGSVAEAEAPEVAATIRAAMEERRAALGA